MATERLYIRRPAIVRGTVIDEARRSVYTPMGELTAERGDLQVIDENDDPMVVKKSRVEKQYAGLCPEFEGMTINLGHGLVATIQKADAAGVEVFGDGF